MAEFTGASASASIRGRLCTDRAHGFVCGPPRPAALRARRLVRESPGTAAKGPSRTKVRGPSEALARELQQRGEVLEHPFAVACASRAESVEGATATVRIVGANGIGNHVTGTVTLSLGGAE